MRIYKISDLALWRAAIEAGVFAGSADDVRDGFIHLSTADQVAATLARHFAGRDDLVIAAIEAAALEPALRWEPSRGGALFPHLYGPLAMTTVIWQQAIALGDDGIHILPPEMT